MNIANPIDIISRRTKEIAEEAGLEYKRLYDDSAILSDPNGHLVRYQLFAKQEEGVITIGRLLKLTGGEKKTELIEDKLRQIKEYL